MIPEGFIQDLLARVDIVDLIDGHVPLKKAGANFAACCPFHNEKTPSFTVSPSKQFYHCFGCGAHGTAIGFLMEYSGLGFVESVKDLAQRTGMQVPDDGGRPEPTRRGPDLLGVMSAASRYYRDQLKHSQRAIEYLKSRGLSGETAARFGIGYAPDGWQNLEAAFPDYANESLQTAGLVIRNEGGRTYDRFRDRIMFPILSAKGEVIAFGGRVIGDGEPKYLNSPETPLFEKGRELFGLPQARQGLREQNLAIVVEGYMDVVALSQHGVGNALATLGTATTPEHARKLFRQVDQVVFCFDGDAAGRKAAWRALENTLDIIVDNKQIAFAFLPEADDPDSFVRQHGADAFRGFVRRALPLSEYLVQELARRHPPDSAEGRVALLHDAKPLLGKIASPAYRLQLVKRLGDITETTPGEIESLCGLRPVAALPAAKRVVRATPSLARSVARLILRQPALAAQLPDEALPGGTEGGALRALRDAAISGQTPTTAALIERLHGVADPRWLEALSAEVISHPLDDDACQTEFA
ncbi:MAG TPA: DNA primase, partial [Rhodocyclaceae bacterium]